MDDLTYDAARNLCRRPRESATNRKVLAAQKISRMCLVCGAENSFGLQARSWEVQAGAAGDGDKPPTTPDVDALFAELKAKEGLRLQSHGPVTLPRPKPGGLWNTTLQWVVAALITLMLAWFTYANDGWVPLLSYFDLGVHEFGHLLTIWAPELIVWPAGSFLQVAGPLALSYYFYRRGDRFAVVVVIAWAAESLNNVSVYMYDATRMVLPLFGDDGSGAGHDWHNILTRLDLLGSTDGLAHFVRFLSVLLFVFALGLAVWWFTEARRTKT